ncbi:MAG: hypothetical protein EOO38_23310, partial [Cytophagaceae bacterium]
PSESGPPNSDPTATNYDAWTGRGSYSDYFLNNGLTTDGVLGRSDAELEQPVLTIMAGDNGTWNSANYRPYGNGYQCSGLVANCSTEAIDPVVAKRHLEAANYLFCDGHVGWFPESAILVPAPDICDCDKTKPHFCIL